MHLAGGYLVIEDLFAIWLMKLGVRIGRGFYFALYVFVVPDLPLALIGEGVSPAAL